MTVHHDGGEPLEKPLRVLMLGPYPRGGLVNGGVGAAVEALALELSSHRDVEAIEIISLRGDVPARESVIVNSGLTVHFVPGQRRAVLATRGYWDYLQAKRIAMAFRPTVVHGHGLLSEGEMATRLGFPAVVTIHGMAHLEARALEKRPVIGKIRIALIERTINRVLSRARVVVSISEYDQQILGSRMVRPVYRVPNAVRPLFFTPGYTEPPEPRILFAGLLVPRKNVPGIIRAFAKVRAAVPEARLELAGPCSDERYLAMLMAEAREYGDGGVTFLGGLTSEQLSARLKHCAVVVLFSHQETLPCIIAEAMASARPVVSSSVGGVPEMVADGMSGMLVRPGDEDSLAASLIRILLDPALSRAMGESGHALALTRWSPAGVAAETIKAYRAAMRQLA